MMLLAELARREGLFDFLAGLAVRHADGSAPRLFALPYAIGTLVTIFMSNDATAVVLTPAVCAVAKKAGARPLPYLLACALIANAASFVLPISNPANLVIFGEHLPAGLIAGSVVRMAEVPVLIQSAVAIGIDLGPNLSVTGSLATMRWLIAIRREGENVTARQFLRIGAAAMPVALALALAALLLQARVLGVGMR